MKIILQKYKTFILKWKKPFLDFLANYKIAFDVPKFIRKEILLNRKAQLALSVSSLLFNTKTDKRVLGVWDFNTLSGTLGDGVVFQEILNTIMKRHNLRKIDIAYIDDCNHTNAELLKYKKPLAWKRNIASIHLINPFIGSVFYFDSNAQFNRFLRQNIRKYIVHPLRYNREGFGKDQQVFDIYASKNSWSLQPLTLPQLVYDWKILNNYWEELGILPALTCKREVINKVLSFLEGHVYPALPVVIQIRKNPGRGTNRNSNIDIWYKFIKSRQRQTQFVFVIIGHKEECPSKFLHLSNVLFSKDFFNTFEDDLALIQTSYLGLFPVSGPATFAWFANIPCLTFGFDSRSLCHVHDLQDNQTYPFLNKYQRMFWGETTLEKINQEFDNLVRKLNKINWNNSLCKKRTDEAMYIF